MSTAISVNAPADIEVLGQPARKAAGLTTQQPRVPCWFTAALVGLSVVSITALAVAASLFSRVQALADSEVTLKRTAIPAAGFTALSLFDGAWGPGVHLPEERSDFQAVACGPKIFLLGGLTGAGATTGGLWAFDPLAESYATRAPMPSARYRFSAACLDGKVYVAGGYASTAEGDAGNCLDAVDVYDVSTNTWVTGPKLGLPRGDLALVAAAGKVYAIGGYGVGYPENDPALSAIEELDPSAATWTRRAPMPGGKGDISAVEIGGRIYVPGG